MSELLGNGNVLYLDWGGSNRVYTYIKLIELVHSFYFMLVTPQ